MFIEINDSIYNVINIQNLIKSQDGNKYYITYIIKNGSSVVEEFDDESSRNSKCDEVEAAGGGQSILIDKNISANGTYNASSDSADGYKKVVVDVPATTYPDWTAIGYQGTPQEIIDGYNYAIQVKNNWDSSITNMNGYFQNNVSLKYMPLVDVSNVQTANYMFNNCQRLEAVPRLEFSNIVNLDGITYMFNDCKALEEVSIKVDSTAITTLKSVFCNCYNLKELSLKDWNIPNVTSMNNTFDHCQSLRKLDVSSIDFTKLVNNNSTFAYVPTDCLIIVKDQTQKDWFATIYTNYTNVQTVDEYENNS